jgi:hypothetical protein
MGRSMMLDSSQRNSHQGRLPRDDATGPMSGRAMRGSRSALLIWWGMEVRDSLAIWDPTREADLVLDPGKLAAYVGEKARALEAARGLVARVEAGAPGLDQRVHDYVKRAFAHYVAWVKGLALTATVCLYARRLASSANTPRDRQEFEQTLDRLEEYSRQIRPLADDASVPHQVRMLVDYQRADDVAREGRAMLRMAIASPGAVATNVSQA